MSVPAEALPFRAGDNDALGISFSGSSLKLDPRFGDASVSRDRLDTTRRFSAAIEVLLVLERPLVSFLSLERLLLSVRRLDAYLGDLDRILNLEISFRRSRGSLERLLRRTDELYLLGDLERLLGDLERLRLLYESLAGDLERRREEYRSRLRALGPDPRISLGAR